MDNHEKTKKEQMKNGRACIIFVGYLPAETKIFADICRFL